MESTYYKLSLGKQKLSEGVFEIKPRDFVGSNAFTHARIELAEKSGYAFSWNGCWVHPTESNFTPLEAESEIVVGQIEYGPTSYFFPHTITVELLKISGEP
jgi:hypothetical protein